MTPPHIEAIARAMKRTEIKKMVSGILSPASIDAHVDASWKTCIPAATLVWSLAIEEAAKRVEQRRDDYIREHGNFDPETGIIELPGNGDEYIGELDEIAEDLRALAVEG